MKSQRKERTGFKSPRRAGRRPRCHPRDALPMRTVKLAWSMREREIQTATSRVQPMHSAVSRIGSSATSRRKRPMDEHEHPPAGRPSHDASGRHLRYPLSRPNQKAAYRTSTGRRLASRRGKPSHQSPCTATLAHGREITATKSASAKGILGRKGFSHDQNVAICRNSLSHFHPQPQHPTMTGQLGRTRYACGSARTGQSPPA